jgi:hypothetical protein
MDKAHILPKERVWAKRGIQRRVLFFVADADGEGRQGGKRKGFCSVASRETMESADKSSNEKIV